MKYSARYYRIIFQQRSRQSRYAWKVNRKAFVINKKNNELRYNAGQTYEADRIIKELPETLEAHKSREIVIMSLEEAKEFFQIDFKKNIFGL